MNEATTWNIHSIKGANPQKYEVASGDDLKKAFRAGDNWAGAQLLKRKKLGITDLDLIKKEYEQEKLLKDMQDFEKELDANTPTT